MAWPAGDEPGLPHFRANVAQDVTAEILETLKDALPDGAARFAELTSLGPSDGAAGRYCLKLHDVQYFVRVTARWGRPALEADIVAFLASEGVAVIPFSTAGLTLNWQGDKFRVDLRPLVPGRHFEGAVADTNALARVLADCHAALRLYPRAPEVRQNAVERHRRLESVVVMLQNAIANEDLSIFGIHADWARQRRDWLAEIAECFLPNFESRGGAQVLHGEIHPGNVLFRSADGAPVLLDFEESVATYAPPDWDLAYFLQRFLLRGTADPASARAAITPPLSVYGVASIDTNYFRETCWSAMMTILDLCVNDQTETSISEYQKFYELDRKALTLFGISR